MTDLSAEDTVLATFDPIHDIGTAIYLGRRTSALAAEWGWANPFAFYVAGRGGMLGDVDGDVVAAAFGWFDPATVLPLYEEGRSVAGALGAADRMMEATARWGRTRFAEIDPSTLDRFVRAAGTLVDGSAAAGLPLFAGWRAHERADDPAGLASQLCQILREWRGAVHLAATTAVGLGPLEAILANGREGVPTAEFLGWAGPFPDCSGLVALHDEAEAMTNRRCAAEVDRLLTAPGRTGFVEDVGILASTLTRRVRPAGG